MFCLVVHFPALFYFLIFTRIRFFLRSIGTAYEESFKKKKKKRKEKKTNKIYVWTNKKAEEAKPRAEIGSESIFLESHCPRLLVWILTFSSWFDIKLLLYFYDDRDYKYIHIYTHR
jgi:hypothetical protein